MLSPFSDQITILTLILLFSAGTKSLSTTLSLIGYLCRLEGTPGKVQEKGGGIVGASCWPAHWPIVGFIFQTITSQ